jgi:predicted RNase H-like nuclease (RuvC/YqgF family)
LGLLCRYPDFWVKIVYSGPIFTQKVNLSEVNPVSLEEYSIRARLKDILLSRIYYLSAAMLHLAQVKKKDLEGKVMLQLLAQQKSEYAWLILSEEKSDIWVDAEDCHEGSLVLVEISPTHEVQKIQDATHWVLEIVKQYLSTGVTPDFLQEEVQRAEQWRQSLTLQSQELGRRALEMEARRDQIQELEENLKQEKKKLELLEHQLKADINEIQSETLNHPPE